MKTITPANIHSLRDAVHPLTGAGRDYGALLDRIGNSKFVLIGEASHGTHEFYQQRAEITGVRFHSAWRVGTAELGASELSSPTRAIWSKAFSSTSPAAPARTTSSTA